MTMMILANGENDMDKNEILKILETAKDENDEVPMRLVRQAFEKLPESCEDTVSRQAAIDAVIKRDANCGIDSAEVLKSLPSVQSAEAIPVAFLEEQAKWFESMDNSFAKIEANNIRVMIKKWRSKKDDRSD